MNTHERSSVPVESGALVALKERILDALRLTSGSNINMVYAIYSVVRDANPEFRSALLRLAADNFDDSLRGRTKEVPVEEAISRTELEKMEEQYGAVVDSMFKTLVGQNEEEDTFYSKLWAIVENPFFVDEPARVYALYNILIDKRIPYFKLDNGLKMSNEDFGQRLKVLRPKANKIRFILTRDFQQRTEQADLAFKEVLSPSDPTDRVVLFATLVSELRQELELIRRMRR